MGFERGLVRKGCLIEGSRQYLATFKHRLVLASLQILHAIQQRPGNMGARQ